MNTPRSWTNATIGACLLLGLAGCGSSRYTESYCRDYYERVAVYPTAYDATIERNCQTPRRGRSFFFFNTGGGSNRSPSGSFRGGGPGSGK